jgi:hypothetical protein
MARLDSLREEKKLLESVLTLRKELEDGQEPDLNSLNEEMKVLENVIALRKTEQEG